MLRPGRRSILRAAERDTLVRLNLGSGNQWAEGWVSLDNSMGVRLARHPILKKILHAILPAKVLPSAEWSDRITWMNLTKAFPFESNSVEALYTSHFLEHLPRPQAKRVLAESFRTMKSGGTIRVIVPDLSAIVEDYLRGAVDRVIE